MNIKWNAPTAEALARGIVALLAVINLIAASVGWQPIQVDEASVQAGVDAAYAAASAVLAAGSTLWAWWKNNSVTEAAQEGDALMDEIKSRAKHAKAEPDAGE